VELETFRQRVRETFGAGLEKATAESVQEFVRKWEAEGRGEPPPSGRYLLADGSPETINQILRDYFVRVLDLPPAEAVISLWLTAADMAFRDEFT